MGSIPVTGMFVCNPGQVALLRLPRSKWVPAAAGELACDGPASHPGGVILPVAYAIETGISSGTDESHGPGNSLTVTDFTLPKIRKKGEKRNGSRKCIHLPRHILAPCPQTRFDRAGALLSLAPAFVHRSGRNSKGSGKMSGSRPIQYRFACT